MINIDCRSTTFILPRMFRQNLGEVPCLLCRANKLIPTKRVIGTEMSTFSCEYALHWHWDSPFCMSRGLCLHRKSPLPSSPLLQFLAVEKWRTHCAYLAFLDQDSLPSLPRPPSDPILRSQFVGRSRDLCVREISFYLSSSSEFCRSAGGILCDCREVGGGDIAGDGGSLSDIVQTQN